MATNISPTTRLSIIAVGLLILATTAPACAQEESIELSKLRIVVQQFVEQLGSDVLASRNDAETGLVRLGPGVLPLLPRDRDIAETSVRSSLARIRRELWVQQANASIQPSTVDCTSLTTVQSTGERVEEDRQRFFDGTLRSNFATRIKRLASEPVTTNVLGMR